MTPDELEKEANRLTDEWPMPGTQAQGYRKILDALCAVHARAYALGKAEAYPDVHEIGDAEAYKRGFNMAVEKAAVLADDEYGCDALAVDIRALKLSLEAGGGQ